MLSSENPLDYETYTGRWCQSENKFFVNHGVEWVCVWGGGGGGEGGNHVKNKTKTVCLFVCLFVCCCCCCCFVWLVGWLVFVLLLLCCSAISKSVRRPFSSSFFRRNISDTIIQNVEIITISLLAGSKR